MATKQEERPLPALTKHALAMAQREMQRTLARIAEETVDVLGFTEDDGWTINFDTGLMSRTVEVAEPTPRKPKRGAS